MCVQLRWRNAVDCNSVFKTETTEKWEEVLSVPLNSKGIFPVFMKWAFYLDSFLQALFSSCRILGRHFQRFLLEDKACREVPGLQFWCHQGWDFHQVYGRSHHQHLLQCAGLQRAWQEPRGQNCLLLVSVCVFLSADIWDILALTFWTLDLTQGVVSSRPLCWCFLFQIMQMHMHLATCFILKGHIGQLGCL